MATVGAVAGHGIQLYPTVSMMVHGDPTGIHEYPLISNTLITRYYYLSINLAIIVNNRENTIFLVTESITWNGHFYSFHDFPITHHK